MKTLLPDERILTRIKATTAHFGHEFMSGDCGQFAIALVKYLQEQGVPASYLVEYGSHPEMYDHVTVLVNGVAYDGEGVYHRKKGKQWDESNDQEYKVQYLEYAHGEEAERSIGRFTDNSAVFARGAEWQPTLEFMRGIKLL